MPVEHELDPNQGLNTVFANLDFYDIICFIIVKISLLQEGCAQGDNNSK